MSTIETILTRMMNEPAFADAVIADAEKALADYDLSDEDFARLKKITAADVSSFQELTPEERKSFGAAVKRVTIKLYVEEMDF